MNLEGRLSTVVAIEQMYPGHERQAAFIAANCHANPYCVCAGTGVTSCIVNYEAPEVKGPCH